MKTTFLTLRILNKLKNFKGLTTENINLISDNCNFDRVKLNNELSKIISCFTDKNIENKKLKSLFELLKNFNVCLIFIFLSITSNLALILYWFTWEVDFKENNIITIKIIILM